MIHPYTQNDIDQGEKIVRELHGLKGYDAWPERIAKAIAAERERCAKVADIWTQAGHILLHAGEMTAQELRSVKAVAKAIGAAIRG